MRKLAQELDTGAASLYVYVKNRDDLLTAMLDEALAEVPLPTSRRGPWQKRLASLVEASIDAMARHQGLALVALGGVPTGLNALLILDRVIALLKEAGLDDATISWAVDLLHLYVTATAAEQWEPPTGKVMQFLEIAAAAITHHKPDHEGVYRKLHF